MHPVSVCRPSFRPLSTHSADPVSLRTHQQKKLKVPPGLGLCFKYPRKPFHPPPPFLDPTIHNVVATQTMALYTVSVFRHPLCGGTRPQATLLNTLRVWTKTAPCRARAFPLRTRPPCTSFHGNPHPVGLLIAITSGKVDKFYFALMRALLVIPLHQQKVEDIPCPYLIQTKSLFELEHRVLRVDGTLGWPLSRAIPISDAEGEIMEWFGAASDITERKQAEDALNNLNQELERRTSAPGGFSWLVGDVNSAIRPVHEFAQLRSTTAMPTSSALILAYHYLVGARRRNERNTY